MISTQLKPRLDLAQLGIEIKPAEPSRQLWQLSDIQIHALPARRQSGNLTMIACDPMGIPVREVEFIVGWLDMVILLLPDYGGRCFLRLDRSYNPAIQKGPYWAGFSTEGIADEIHGFGIPTDHSIEIKVIYTQLY